MTENIYQYMIDKLRTAGKNDFFKLMNNSVFGKLIENLGKHWDIRLVATDKRKKLFSFRTKPSHKQMVFRVSTSNRNEWNTSKSRYTYLIRPANIRNQQNNNVWALVCLHYANKWS